jgi:uncharacterized SAM-binding protein YcdF (DUF218 family)
MTEAEITELLFRRDPLAGSDLAFVFGHHDAHVSTERARHAASLFLHGHTSRLLLSGGATGNGGQSEAEHMAAVAQGLGVPPEALLLEAQSRTTVENLSLAVSLLDRQSLLDSIRTVHLVSCPWHMRRVLHLASIAFGPTVSLLASPHDESCTATAWASSAECRKRVLAELRLVKPLLGCR